MRLKKTKLTKKDILDTETGEVVQTEIEESKEFSTRVKSENFFMTFLAGMDAIEGISTLTERKVLDALNRFADYNTGIVQINKAVKEKIVIRAGLKYQTVCNSLTELAKKGFIKIHGGECVINHKYFWRGELGVRQKHLSDGGAFSVIINFEREEYKTK
jgi:hypothetical protein